MDSQPEPRVFMPPAFTLTQPAEADFFASGVVLTRGENAVFTWTSQVPSDPDAPGRLAFALFTTEEDVREVLCFDLDSNGDGGITVPAEVLDQVSPTGEISVGSITHVGSIQERYVTRLDLIGIDSKAASYSVAQ